MTDARQDALQEIVTLARRHDIKAQEINTALAASTDAAVQKTLMARLFSYIGGILIFSGLAVFIGMFWNDFPPFFRVVITLGTGFAAFVAAVACHRRVEFSNAVAPLFLIASFLQPGGLFVMLDEYASGGNWRHAILFVSGIMAFQYAMTFIRLRHSVLAFFGLAFAGAFAGTGMDLLGMDDNLIGIALGISYLCLATALAQAMSARQAGFWHLAGALFLLCSFYDVVRGAVYEPAFLGLAALLIYLSIVVKSRALLIVSTCAMIWYIGSYAFEYFASSGLFPLGLIVAGGIFMGLGAAAMKIDRRFIRQK